MVTPPTVPTHSRSVEERESAAPQGDGGERGAPEELPATPSDEQQLAFAQMKNEQIDALVIQPSLLRKQIIDLIFQYRLPAVSPNRAFPDMGGLIAYDSKRRDLYRKTATYVDKILKGAKPADLPVEQPTNFELVINLKAAKVLGLAIPPALLARADEVIE